MRKRNYTVTIRMNKEEYDLFQSKVKESGRTQQEVVIKAIAGLKIASAEEVEELKRLNQMFADILCQLRGATTNINQIARKLHTDGEIPNDSMLYFLNKNILKYRKESERIRKNTAGSCNKSNRRFEDSFYRGSGRTEKIEPDVCRYSQSASWSYYKYQSDCKKAAYRWRSSK